MVRLEEELSSTIAAMRRLMLATLLVLVPVAIWLRFTSLGTKVYWHDETWSSFEITGHQTKEFEQLPRPFTLAQLRTFQEPDGRRFTTS